MGKGDEEAQFGKVAASQIAQLIFARVLRDDLTHADGEEGGIDLVVLQESVPAEQSNGAVEVDGIDFIVLEGSVPAEQHSRDTEREEEVVQQNAIVNSRSPTRVYSKRVAHWRGSLSLHLWRKISQVRADHPADRVYKLIASGAYFSIGVLSILETAVRGTGAFVIGNPVSRTVPVIFYQRDARRLHPIIFDLGGDEWRPL